MIWKSTSLGFLVPSNGEKMLRRLPQLIIFYEFQKCDITYNIIQRDGVWEG
jgi:hypothetical protein